MSTARGTRRAGLGALREQTSEFVQGAVATGLLLLATGCGRPFHVQTAPGLVELENQAPAYDYRAIAPEGVVVGVRAIDVRDRGDLDFWTRATLVRMRQLNGYALLGTDDVKSRDGTPGRELRFGHDESGKPYLYSLRLFVAQGRLFVVEAGGPRAEMDRYKANVDWTMKSLKVRCDALLAPVFASRTCNRW
jgi:hypothetical protein